MKAHIYWYYDTLTPGMRAFPFVVDEGIEELLERLASDMEEYARTNASWEDETGDAREGLTAEVVDGGPFRNSVVLYHTVDYGIWLEIRWNGRYAIILPTIEHFGPQIMGALAFGEMQQ